MQTDLHMPFHDAVIQWWEQVHVNHVFSVEQLSTANLMKSNLKWSHDKQTLTLLNVSAFLTETDSHTAERVRIFKFCWNATRAPEYDKLLLNMFNFGFVGGQFCT